MRWRLWFYGQVRHRFLSQHDARLLLAALRSWAEPVTHKITHLQGTKVKCACSWTYALEDPEALSRIRIKDLQVAIKDRLLDAYNLHTQAGK